MSIFSFFKKAKQSDKEQNPSPDSLANPDQSIEADLGYQRLEERQVLSASFSSLGAGMLTIDGFDDGSNLIFEQVNTSIDGTTEDGYQFTLADGSAWNDLIGTCLLYTSPSPRDLSTSRMPSSA